MPCFDFKLLFQKILNSTIHIDKNLEYNLLLPFIGTGLVTSSGKNCLKKKLLYTQKLVLI